MNIRVGIQDAKDKFIDPEPTQTSTGNCAAYAAASALYALSLDRSLPLVPSANDSTAEAQFQVQLARMVERLTDLIYTQNKGVAGGIRRYIEEMHAASSLEVTEYSGDGTTTYNGKVLSNWTYLVMRMFRGDGVIPFLEWERKKSNGKMETVRHAISLCGNEPDAHSIIAANPWGTPFSTVGVGAVEAGVNTAAGLSRSHNLYKVSQKGKSTYLDFHSNTARVYHFVRISKPLKKSIAIRSHHQDKAAVSRSAAPGHPAQSFSYRLENGHVGRATGLAIPLPGLQERDIVGIQSPPGWSARYWYRDQETFDRRAPELETRADESFVGIIWRPVDRRASLAVGRQLQGFGISVMESSGAEDIASLAEQLSVQAPQVARAVNHIVGVLRRARTWTDDETGTALVLRERDDGAEASHVRVAIPRRFCSVPQAAERLARLLTSWRPVGESQGPADREQKGGTPPRPSRKQRKVK